MIKVVASGRKGSASDRERWNSTVVTEKGRSGDSDRAARTAGDKQKGWNRMAR